MKLVYESLNEFKSGVPHFETKIDFLNWWNNMFEQNPDEDWEFIVSSLVNDEVSSDEELIEYLIDNGADEEIVWELLQHRQGFLSYGLDVQI